MILLEKNVSTTAVIELQESASRLIIMPMFTGSTKLAKKFLCGFVVPGHMQGRDHMNTDAWKDISKHIYY